MLTSTNQITRPDPWESFLGDPAKYWFAVVSNQKQYIPNKMKWNGCMIGTNLNYKHKKTMEPKEFYFRESELRESEHIYK